MSSDSSQSSSPIPFRLKKKLNLTPKPKAQSSGSLTNPTPDKPPEPPRRSRIGGEKDQIKSARKQILSGLDGDSASESKSDGSGGSIKLPEKYDVLGEFFDSLDSSIRLIRLKGSMPTFAKICPKIESLTDRRFTHAHLAQMKFILPEAIELKKVLVFDEQTSCMKPDIHVTLNVDAIEVDDDELKRGSKNIYLRKVFRGRLLDFFKAHPEGDEVPEEELPVPYHPSKQGLPSDTIKSPSSSLPIDTSVNTPSVVASHLSQSFRRRFSQRNSTSEAEYSCQTSPNVSCQPQIAEEENIVSIAVSPVKLHSKPAVEVSSALTQTPSKPLDSINSKDPSTLQATPAKLVFTPDRLMSVTPAMPPSKRSYTSKDSEPTSSSQKLVRRALHTSLEFDTPEKSDRVGRSSLDNDIYGILHDSVILSIREKESEALEERDPAISQAKRWKQMIGSLPKLFTMIRFLFQSINRSVITKEELLHKIIAGHCEVVDRREVEEQLTLLLELVPEWISEKSASCGDLLLCIKKTTSPESTRARLEEAK